MWYCKIKAMYYVHKVEPTVRKIWNNLSDQYKEPSPRSYESFKKIIKYYFLSLDYNTQ